jgi:hypothetical protein
LGTGFANKAGYVQIGDKRHVFMVYTRHDKHGSNSQEVDWHHHTFYFRTNTTKATISFGSMTGNTGILFDDIKVQQAILHDHDDSEAHGKHVHAHVVALHQWSSIHAPWGFVDPESPIIDYMNHSFIEPSHVFALHKVISHFSSSFIFVTEIHFLLIQCCISYHDDSHCKKKIRFST